MEDYEVFTEEYTEEISFTSTSDDVSVGSDVIQSDPPETTEDISEDIKEDVSEVSEDATVFEDLLKEFIEQKVLENEKKEMVSEENDNNTDNVSDILDISDNEFNDYTEFFNDVISAINDNTDSINDCITFLNLQSSNNLYDSQFDNINGTNFLLVCIFAAILFNAALNFARRIL